MLEVGDGRLAEAMMPRKDDGVASRHQEDISSLRSCT